MVGKNREELLETAKHFVARKYGYADFFQIDMTEHDTEHKEEMESNIIIQAETLVDFHEYIATLDVTVIPKPPPCPTPPPPRRILGDKK